MVTDVRHVVSFTDIYTHDLRYMSSPICTALIMSRAAGELMSFTGSRGFITLHIISSPEEGAVRLLTKKLQ